MPNIRIAVSGLRDCIAVVQPHLPEVASAFSMFGIGLVFGPGELLAVDPSTVPNPDGAWRSLVSALTARGRPTGTANLILTKTPPGHDGAINGELFDTEWRGAVAIFLGANAFQGNPAQHADVLVQVLIHEIGHMLNLTHDDAREIDGSIRYANALLPERMREGRDIGDAWVRALTEARNSGEPPFAEPDSAQFFPFSSRCRANLRMAQNDQRWLPYQSEFRGNPGEYGSNLDSSLRLSVKLDGSRKTVLCEAPIYLAVELKNVGKHPIALPAQISPEAGTLSVEVLKEGELTNQYRAARLRCGSETETLLPGKVEYRYLSLLSPKDRALFSEPGRFSMRFTVLNHFRAQHGIAAATLDVSAKGDVDARRVGRAIADLEHGEEPATNLPASTREKHPVLEFHLKLAKAERSGKLSSIVSKQHSAPGIPTALRHRVVKHVALHKLTKKPQKRTYPNQLEAMLEKSFFAPKHRRLRQRIRQMEILCDNLRSKGTS